MAFTKEEKGAVTTGCAAHPDDTSSPGAQVALLSKRIKDLTEHFKAYQRDCHFRRDLMLLVGQRERLLGCLQEADIERYRSLKDRLGLRR